MASSEEDDAPLTIECDEHGTSIAAVVCRHMLQPAWRKVGFVENNDDPDDLQAWCEKCERMYLAEGKSERFIAFNDFKLVCAGCYAAIKRRHAR